MIDNAPVFAQTDSSTLTGVVPGTLLEDLAGLAGCFGAYYRSSSFGLPFDGYEVWRFDRESGELKYQIAQGPAFVEYRGQFSIAAPDRIRVRRVLADGTELVSEALVSLSDNQLRIAYETQDGNILDGTAGPPGDGRVALVFTAFECP